VKFHSPVVTPMCKKCPLVRPMVRLLFASEDGNEKLEPATLKLSQSSPCSCVSGHSCFRTLVAQVSTTRRTILKNASFGLPKAPIVPESAVLPTTARLKLTPLIGQYEATDADFPRHFNLLVEEGGSPHHDLATIGAVTSSRGIDFRRDRDHGVGPSYSLGWELYSTSPV
jgi:hypothetical protein